MTNNRFRDFDAAWEEETEGDPIVVRVYGKDWELPPRMSAAVFLRLARYMEDLGSAAELSAEQLLAIAGDIVPGVILDSWLAKGMSIERLSEIVEYVMSQYQGGQDEQDAGDGAAGEGDAPATGRT